MCYPKPGPRCSGHAKHNYMEAKALLDSLNESNEPLDTPTYKRANAKLSRAKVDYLETPAGITLLRKNGRHDEAHANETIRAKSIANLKASLPQVSEADAHQGVEGFKDYIQAPAIPSPTPKKPTKPAGNNPFSPAFMPARQPQSSRPHTRGGGNRHNPHRPNPRVNAVAHLARLTPDMVRSETASYGRSHNNENATMTANQAKKHRSHMSEAELTALGKSLNTIGDPNTNVVFTKHAQNRPDFQATQEEVQELLSRPDIQDRIIEYNVNKYDNGKMDRRVLIRDDRAVNREYTVNGGKEWREGPSNACYSISLDSKQVITTYYNAAGDHHRSIDESRYTPNLKIV